MSASLARVVERSADRLRGGALIVLTRPAVLFAALSVVFGTLIIVLNPPLRGPDEPAHFMRVYAMARGAILPSLEIDGRKGFYLPGDVFNDYAFFDAARRRVWTKGFTYWSVIDEYRARDGSEPAHASVFVPYAGSEPYTPVNYAPHVLGALVARLLEFDFVGTIYVMRWMGLVVTTAAAAYAILLTPHLKWAFLLIAMLPSSLYGRSVVSADGMTFSLALLITALALRAALASRPGRVWERSLWMTLCVLTKPPQLAFTLLEFVHGPTNAPRRYWLTVLLVVLPGLILTPLWIWAVGAEAAPWRLVGEGHAPAEHFELSWKLGFLLHNPLHFAQIVASTFWLEAYGLWRQLIGFLGWLDVPLNDWAYPVLTLALLAVPFERLGADVRTRLRIAIVLALTTAGYTMAVFLILFITWTPPAEPVVWGVQGRYFVPVLPALAVIIAALANRALPSKVTASAAVCGALISGFAALEAVWRVHWTPWWG